MNQNAAITQEYPGILNQYAGLNMLHEMELDALINTFEPISLQEMDSVALLNRTDTKYILSVSQLICALRRMRFSYRVLTIQHKRAHRYQTRYFDTPDFTLYHQHVTGRAHVYKVRAREYLDTHLAYLEVKHKNPKKRTEKSRLPISCQCQGLDGQMCDFLGNLLPLTQPSKSWAALEPKLWNAFRRITLVSKTDLERLTIDVDLCFYNDQQTVFLDGIAIAEIKRDQFSHGSEFAAEMRRQGIRENGFSKYCYGAAQLYPTIKTNALKERVLKIEKLQRGGMYHV